MEDFKEKRYNQFSRHLEDIFRQKVYKITLSAGFNCPNRDGTISTGGCIFCDEGGSFSRAYSDQLSIENQIDNGISFLKKRFKAEKFISYFQAFTNTYAPVEVLKDIYSRAVEHEDVIGLSIGTRPDCVDAEKIDLISSIAENKYVWVEYGLQSIHNRTLNLINRGHTAEDFINAVNLTKNKGINICAHVIIGLPGENKQDILETAKLLADLGINGVKFHLLCALKGTTIEQMYYRGEFNPISIEEYVDIVCDFLEILPPEVSIHRLAGNGLNEILIAPNWLPQKFKVLNRIDRELLRRDSFQGKFFKK
jgi:radical SAM protein (TIGR01212 family)